MNLVTVQINTSTPEGQKEAMRLIRKAKNVSHIKVIEDVEYLKVKAMIYKNMQAVKDDLSGEKTLPTIEDFLAELQDED